MTSQQPGSPAATTEADVEVLGRVLQVNIPAGTFELWPDGETKITVVFTPELERRVIGAMTYRTFARLQVQGRGEFADGKLQRIAKIHQTKTVLDKRETPPGHRPIWEKIADIMKDAPREELAKLPKDLAKNHDHYLYGTPKK